tara:strand:- start:445 stop:771 length:327 start_codon:yes stop_codon:yes gene_type:complete
MSIARTLADTVAAAGILNDGVITAAEVSGINIVTTSATAPVSPSAGDLWLSTEDGSLAIYLNDGDTLQWIVVSGPRGSAGADGTDGTDGADGTSISAGKTIALAMIFG